MLDRREVLGMTGRAGLVAACAILLACDDGAGEAAAAGESDAIGASDITSTIDAIATIGRRYLAVTAGENDARTLRPLVGMSDEQRVDVDALERRFDTAVRQDFAAGRTVLVDGWVLSLTEARLAAIVALERR